MKPLFSRLTFATFIAHIVVFAPTARAFDAGPSLQLERYNVLSNGDIQHEDGFLLSSGKFSVLDSEIYDSLELDPTFDYTVISGHPICLEEYYDTYEAERIIPHWVRSRDDFAIGQYIPLLYVIVAIRGQDPNPTITITAQPTNQTVLSGELAVFYVDASPIEYISYQWLQNGKPLEGQTVSALSLINVTAKEAGNYSVSMTTGGKNVTSKKALLRVVAPVTISTEPKSQTVKAGRNVVFRVAVKGTGPFTYQWYFDGSPVPKATSSFYTVKKAQPSDAGTYSVIVSNGASMDYATPATLTVTPGGVNP